MLLCSSELKSLNNSEKIQLRLIYTPFNGNLCTTPLSCYSSKNVNDEKDIVTFYELPFLV